MISVRSTSRPASSNALTAVRSSTPRKPADVEVWLKELGLGRYTAMLVAEGLDHFSIIRNIKEDSIDDLIEICGMPKLHAEQFRLGLGSIKADGHMQTVEKAVEGPMKGDSMPGQLMHNRNHAGDEAPRAVLPSIVGRPKTPGTMVVVTSLVDDNGNGVRKAGSAGDDAPAQRRQGHATAAAETGPLPSSPVTVTKLSEPATKAAIPAWEWLGDAGASAKQAPAALVVPAVVGGPPTDLAAPAPAVPTPSWWYRDFRLTDTDTETAERDKLEE